MSIRQSLAVFICIVMAVALVWSKALLSIATVLLAIVAAFDIQVDPLRIRWILKPDLIRGTIKYKPFIWVFALFTILYIISIVYAGNLKEWWVLTNISMPFLLISMSFAVFKPFTRRDYMLVTLGMITMAFWSSVLVQIFYFQNHFIFSESLGMGGSLPVPTNHIRYSVIVACCVIICLFYAIENWKVKYQWERWAYALLALYFFIFLHILSVRTGIAIAYAGIFILVIFYLRKLSWWKKLALVGLVIAAPVVAYKTLRGFEQKMHYMIWDFGKFIRGEGSTYSDSERWESMKAGIDIGKQHFFFGTGTGKFRSELKKYYSEVLGKEKWTRPHNQFINVFACFGIFGLIVFLFILVYPMTFRKFWSLPLVPTLYLMLIISMLVEHPLDTQVGAGLFLLLTIMGLSMLDDEKWGIPTTPTFLNVIKTPANPTMQNETKLKLILNELTTIFTELYAIIENIKENYENERAQDSYLSMTMIEDRQEMIKWRIKFCSNLLMDPAGLDLKINYVISELYSFKREFGASFLRSKDNYILIQSLLRKLTVKEKELEELKAEFINYRAKANE